MHIFNTIAKITLQIYDTNLFSHRQHKRILVSGPTPVGKQHWVLCNLKINVSPTGENDISLFIFGISFILNDIIHLFKCLLSIDISLYIDCLFVAFSSLFYLIIFFLLIPKTLCFLRKLTLCASKYLFAFFSLNKNISSSSLRELF